MTLLDAILVLDSLDDGKTIYAAEPWTDRSQVVIRSEPESGDVPAELRRLGLKYFLEVFVARDFLEGWAGSLDSTPTPQERCARLIHYALHDA
jgi:hypothetical protein